MDLGIAGAAAVVVGGSRGMGFATARCLAADGARVAIIGRNADTTDAAARQLGRDGSPDALGLVADIRQDSQVRRCFDEIAHRWDANLNILVNAVGTTVVGAVADLSDEQWHGAIDEIALGMVRCMRAALPLMRRADWARIVNFSAISTQRQNSMLPAYTAAKSMVTSISKNLSLALAPEEILVNVISPGAIATEDLQAWAGSLGLDGTDPYVLRSALDEHVGHASQLPRAGFAEEVGTVAAFMCSRRNSYMTGANINVDGGSDFI